MLTGEITLRDMNLAMLSMQVPKPLKKLAKLRSAIALPLCNYAKYFINIIVSVLCA